MARRWKDNHLSLLTVVGLLAWVVPGGGHFALGDRKRAGIIFVTILVTFLLGLYIGSIGVIDRIGAKPWYAAQVMNSPAVILIGNHVVRARRAAEHQADPTLAYLVYARPNEIGQIYTSVAGLLNLLCIVNAIYLAHLQSVGKSGA